MLTIKNSVYATGCTRCRLLTLLLLATTFQASAQILVDNCNTGPFSISGPSAMNDIVAPGAIGGMRDVQITNTSVGFMNLNTCPQNNSAPVGNGNMAALEGLKLELTPNPAGDVVTLQLGELSGEQEVSLEIYNSLGQLLLRQAFGRVASLSEQIDLGGFGKGLYTVRVKAGSLRLEQKLVISRD